MEVLWTSLEENTLLMMVQSERNTIGLRILLKTQVLKLLPLLNIEP